MRVVYEKKLVNIDFSFEFGWRTFSLQFLVESQNVEDKIDYDENRNLILKSIHFKTVFA